MSIESISRPPRHPTSCREEDSEGTGISAFSLKRTSKTHGSLTSVHRINLKCHDEPSLPGHPDGSLTPAHRINLNVLFCLRCHDEPSLPGHPDGSLTPAHRINLND
ncbi:unnamed protein product [Arctogadus glacialis]